MPHPSNYRSQSMHPSSFVTTTLFRTQRLHLVKATHASGLVGDWGGTLTFSARIACLCSFLQLLLVIKLHLER